MADKLTCVVVTPEKTAVEAAAEFIAVPLYDGELGVMAGRASLIGRLGAGELRIRQSNGTVQRYFVDGGFVQIQDNVVSLLTSHVVPSTELNVGVIEKRLHDAQRLSGKTPELQHARQRAIESARKQLHLAKR